MIPSVLARQTLKDSYIFNFLTLAKEHNERDLELGLIKHIASFLLELGADFAYIGRQVQLNVGERSLIMLDIL
jgi:predicted nuclease of restriction endonuclease-like (RecB) superfamily